MISISNQDRNQNFWQLASIQTASIGAHGIISGKMIADRYEPGIVIISALIANLILWLIGFSIVAMTAKTRNNAIENAEAYIGRYGAKLAALVSMTVFPAWYVLQMQATTNSIDYSFDGRPVDFTTNIYVIVFGILISFLCLRNLIKKIRVFNTYFLPVLVFYYFYEMLCSRELIVVPKQFEISIPCIVSYLAFSFSGMVNLPTFFRHARSKYDSYIALTVMTIVIIFFQISSIWIPHDILNNGLFQFLFSSSAFLSSLFKFIFIVFCISLLACSALVNIYFAQPSFELFFPKIKKSFLCFIIGLIGTSIYALVEFFFATHPLIGQLENIADNCIANLGASLVFVFLIRIIVKHRPRPFEKLISLAAWLVGCIITVVATVQHFKTPSLLAGVASTSMFFLIVFFIEEPFWSMKKLRILINRRSK
jgi:cytosine permease